MKNIINWNIVTVFTMTNSILKATSPDKMQNENQMKKNTISLLMYTLAFFIIILIEKVYNNIRPISLETMFPTGIIEIDITDMR